MPRDAGPYITMFAIVNQKAFIPTYRDCFQEMNNQLSHRHGTDTATEGDNGQLWESDPVKQEAVSLRELKEQACIADYIFLSCKSCVVF